MLTHAICLTGVSKHFGSLTAVSDLELTIDQGEIFGLLGPNGAGKTTTLQMLLGLSAPSAGQLTVLGLDPTRQASRIRLCSGVVVQQTALDSYLSGCENLEIYADLYGFGKREKAHRMAEVLAWAGLTEAAERPVRTYSGGMKRKLDLAIATLHQPRLLLLDEPTLGLDIHTRRQLWQLIRTMKQAGTTVLLTTHYLEEANALCDRVGIMHAGRLVAVDTPETLRREVTGGLHRLSVRLAHPPDLDPPGLDTLPLPLTPEREGDTLTFSGPPKHLWQTLAVLQQALGEGVLEVGYSQPSLDDVFLHLTEPSRVA